MLRLHPMAIGDILDESFRLYRGNFLTFLGIVAVVQVPLALVTLLVALVMAWVNPYVGMVNPWQTILSPQAMPRYLPGVEYPLGLTEDEVLLIMLVLSLVSFLVSIVGALVGNLIMIGALNRAVSQRYHDRETGLLDAYNIGLRRYWRVLAATLVTALAIWVPFTVFGCVFFVLALIPCFALLSLPIILVAFIPVIYVVIRLSLLSPVAVLERAGPIETLRRSWRLTAGVFWRTFAVFVLSTILAAALVSVPVYLVQVVLIPLSTINYLLVTGIQSVVSTIGQILVYPISIGIVTVLYYDLRIRKEGYDVELLIQSIEAGALVPAGA